MVGGKDSFFKRLLPHLAKLAPHVMGAVKEYVGKGQSGGGISGGGQSGGRSHSRKVGMGSLDDRLY